MRLPLLEPDANLLAIDPGRDKCGIAVVNSSGDIVLHRIVPRGEMHRVVPQLCADGAVAQIVLGHATSSCALEQEIHAWLPHLPLVVVNETGSTLEARPLYWQLNPPRGWRRLLPISLQAPPEPIDDYAAVVLARRYLRAKVTGWRG